MNYTCIQSYATMNALKPRKERDNPLCVPHSSSVLVARDGNLSRANWTTARILLLRVTSSLIPTEWRGYCIGPWVFCYFLPRLHLLVVATSCTYLRIEDEICRQRLPDLPILTPAQKRQATPSNTRWGRKIPRKLRPIRTVQDPVPGHGSAVNSACSEHTGEGGLGPNKVVIR